MRDNPEFTIDRPSDMHCHFRQGIVTELVAKETLGPFGQAVAMPNTKPPITDPAQCREYIGAIMRAADYQGFALGIAYLTDTLSPDVIREGFEGGSWVAAKLYPRGLTTNSENGVTDLRNIYPALEVMQEIGMPLLWHGEILWRGVDELARWQREAACMASEVPKLLADFPTLKVVLEHLSTVEGVELVTGDTSGRLAATITPHHLLFTDADVSREKLFVDANCLPVIKTAEDRRALRRAACSGDSRFFAGTDSAPHDTTSKYARCCSFGAFVAPGACDAYAAVFHQEGALWTADGVQRFEKFMSHNGPDFYGIPRARGTLSFFRNASKTGVTKRFRIPGKKLLEPDVEIVSLFHEELGLVEPFPYQALRWYVPD